MSKAKSKSVANVKTAVRTSLLNGVGAQADVREAEHVLNVKREGMYVCGIRAGIQAGSAEVFTDVIETLEDDFRANKRGIADKYNVPQAKVSKTGKPKVDKDGKPVYIVPSALRTMKSVVLSAYAYRIDLGTEAAPSSFSAVRTAIAAAKDAEAKAARTPDDEARDVIAGALDACKAHLAGIAGKKAMTAALKLVQELSKALEGMNEKAA